MVPFLIHPRSGISNQYCSLARLIPTCWHNHAEPDLVVFLRSYSGLGVAGGRQIRVAGIIATKSALFVFGFTLFGLSDHRGRLPYCSGPASTRVNESF